MAGAVERKGYQFGTFKGVYTPSILTILGVVMYLRMGWVLGNVGLTETLIIITLASSITFLTGLSLAALATNMKVGGGGAYFIISRSLGVEAGAAIGLPLYLAQTLGISFYISGFSESLGAIFPGLDPKLTGIVTLVVLTGIAYISADLALKSQFIIMAIIGGSLVSFFIGAPSSPVVAGAEGSSAGMGTLGFWPVFAVFFPAVTGIEAGIAMSGDLKKPARSLPVGTIAAVLTGLAIYLAIPIALHHAVTDREMLVNDPLVMQKVARWGQLILLGVWAAALSSATGALLGAPRTLQALARDRVLPAFIGKGYGRGNDPRMATALSFALALGGIMLGDMNVIAPLLSMFFLTSYGVLNLSAGLEELITNPSWRPTFRVPAPVALMGFVLCLMVMLMIAPGATMIATLVTAGIYSLMKRRTVRARWGDMRMGVMMFMVRSILHRVAGRNVDERTWRPNLLVLSGAPTSRWYLIELANAMSGGKGFVTVATIIPESTWSAERAASLTRSIDHYLRKHNVQAFVRAFPGANPLAGAYELIQAYGFGPVVPNTILLGETEESTNFEDFVRIIMLVTRTRRNLIIAREGAGQPSARAPEKPEEEDASEAPEPAHRGRIDVWSAGARANVAFILAIIVLLKRSEHFHESQLVLKRIVESPEDRSAAEKQLAEFGATARIPVSAEVLVRGDRTLFEVIGDSSRDAEMVFLGIRPPAEKETAENYSRYYSHLLQETEGLPVTVMAMANEQVDFAGIFEERSP